MGNASLQYAVKFATSDLATVQQLVESNVAGMLKSSKALG